MNVEPSRAVPERPRAIDRPDEDGARRHENSRALLTREHLRRAAPGLGAELFPVGHEASEHGILLGDEKGRFFHLHHTGGYHPGKTRPTLSPRS
ncbi:SUKH-3 domain-containing protein [Streptomyces sp. NPDC001777]|uniref:SUKH-3 domain-containing protein n=1 Tax=Streptomyces sp. NPDC001777 TaxID=3364608 RepID=UPI00367D77F7